MQRPQARRRQHRAQHDEGEKRADTFIQRFETKTCYFRLLKPKKGTPLNDKRRFAEYCAQHGVRTVETLMNLDGKDPGRPLPDRDIFVKRKLGFRAVSVLILRAQVGTSLSL